jgi:GT2 family glycosyltransferase
MKLLISAPLYVTNSIHEEFATLTLNSIKSKHDYDVLIVRNNDSSYSYPNAEFVKNDKNCVSRAWNMALERGDDYDYIILPNLDIVFKEDCIDEMVRFAERNLKDTLMWTASEYSDLRTLNEAQPSKEYAESPHFSCFMVRGSFIKDFVLRDPDGTGKFDEGFMPAYFEDLDMHNRIRLAGFHAYRTTEALFYHFGSRTIQASDDPYQAEMELGSTRTRPYYIEKWGSVNFEQVQELYLNKNK